MSRPVHVVVLISALVAASPAPAQVALRPAGVDLGIGFGFGRGGGLRDSRDGLAASSLVAWHVRALPVGALVVAVGASAQGVIGGGDDCLLTPAGGCAPDYPGFETLGVLGGWAAGADGGGPGVRMLAGLVAAHSEEGAAAAGLQGRLDLSTPAFAHVAVVGWGQAALVPRLRGETYRLGSVGVGVRVR